MSVQFYGKENALKAYENCQIPAWGLFSGRQLLCRYCGDSMDEGATLLDDFLSKIEGSTATYTLKVFELKKGEKIKEKTECDSSFNFKIDNKGDYEERTNRFSGHLGQIGALLERMDQRLAALETPPETEEEPAEEGFLATLGAVAQDELIKFMQNPTEENIIGKVLNMFTGNNRQNYPQQLNRQIAGVQHPAFAKKNNDDMSDNLQDQTQAKKEYTPADVQRLQSAVDILAANDPKIIDHLEKLAIIAQDNPNKFKMLTSMLDTF